MSVHKETYVVRGWRLPYEPFKGKYDEIEPYDARKRALDAKPWDFSIIMDGMSGKWVVIGEVVAATDEDGDFKGSKEYITELSTRAVSQYIVKLRKAALCFVRNNSIDVAPLLHQAPQLMIVEHYH